MSSIWNENLKDFRDRVASTDPTPGGGSVSLAAAAFGCGLLVMAAEISAARPDAGQEVAAKIPGLRELLQKLSDHADRDVAAYNAYVTARTLPKNTQTEMAERDVRLAAALNEAADAPREAAEDILRALRVAEELSAAAHIGIVSDVGAGAALLYGGLSGALFTLDINIRGMKDVIEKKKYLKMRSDLAEQGEKLYRSAAATVLNRLSS